MSKKGYKKNIFSTIFDNTANRREIAKYNRQIAKSNKKSRKLGHQSEPLKFRYVMNGPHKMIETYFWKRK